VSIERDRVISVTLSEAEWQAFVCRHPQPVQWLRERIRDEVREQTVDTAHERPGRKVAFA
jgi:hypothetical protein